MAFQNLMFALQQTDLNSVLIDLAQSRGILGSLPTRFCDLASCDNPPFISYVMYFMLLPVAYYIYLFLCVVPM